MLGTRVVSFVSFMFFVQIFQEILFSYKAKRHYTLFNFENLMRLAFFFVFLIVTLRHYTTYNQLIPGGVGDKEVQYLVRIYVLDDIESEVSYYYAIGSFIMWVNVLYKFRLTRFFGPLYKMIE